MSCSSWTVIASDSSKINSKYKKKKGNNKSTTLSGQTLFLFMVVRLINRYNLFWPLLELQVTYVSIFWLLSLTILIGKASFGAYPIACLTPFVISSFWVYNVQHPSNLIGHFIQQFLTNFFYVLWNIILKLSSFRVIIHLSVLKNHVFNQCVW